MQQKQAATAYNYFIAGNSTCPDYMAAATIVTVNGNGSDISWQVCIDNNLIEFMKYKDIKKLVLNYERKVAAEAAKNAVEEIDVQ